MTPTAIMTSCRPYLIRAMYTWIVDNGLTPYLMVNTALPQVRVPQGFVQEGKIVLNIAPVAVKSLALEVKTIQFSARFNQIVQQVSVPVPAVMGIYAKENGRGMFFDTTEFEAETAAFAKTANTTPEFTKPKLSVIKNNAFQETSHDK